MSAPNTLDSVLAKVDMTLGCWHWMASRDRIGYGTVKYHGHVRRAHRIVYSLLVGPIPGGMELHHTCRNRACVNPAHLEAIERIEHRRMPKTPRTSCLKGHPFTPESTILYAGKRNCRICRRAAERRRYHQRKQAA